MVGRDVDEQADGRVERRRKVDLVGRAFQNMRPARFRRRQVQRRHADVAADRHVPSGFLQNVGDERSRGRFAVGAGHGHEWRVRSARGALARKELDVADDRHARFVGAPDRPVRLRMRERHARREHEKPKAAPVRFAQVHERESRFRRALARLRIVVPGRNVGAAGDEGAQGRKPRASKPEDRDRLPPKRFHRRHRSRHLNFSVPSPIIASTKAMIQKRITTCDSDQPNCSK